MKQSMLYKRKSLMLRQRACQAGILPCLDQNLPSPCFQITIESNSNTSSTSFLQILRAIDALCRFKHFCSGKRYFPELFCREESCLIAVVRGLFRGHVTPERLNRPGILFALVIPLDKLKKTVPGNTPEPAPIRGSAIDGSQRIRTSPQWQVYLTSNQSIVANPSIRVPAMAGFCRVSGDLANETTELQLRTGDEIGALMVYDSQYTCDQCTAPRPPGHARHVKNATVIAVCRRMLQAVTDRQVVTRWVKVKGHSGHEGNEAADTRATWAQNGGTKGESNISNLMAYLRQHG